MSMDGMAPWRRCAVTYIVMTPSLRDNKPNSEHADSGPLGRRSGARQNSAGRASRKYTGRSMVGGRAGT